MKNNSNKQKIKETAEDHIKLGMLLKKKRSEEKKKATNKILQGNLCLREKIKKIEEIDNFKGHTVNEEDETLFSLQIVKENRKKIKTFIKANKFLKFLFKDWQKIKRFGNKTHTIIAGFLPFNMQINPNIKSSFVKYLQKNASDLKKSIKYFLNIGWLYITKEEYNLIVTLKLLCSNIISVNFGSLNYHDKSLINKVSILERYFLLFYYKSNYIDTLIAAISRIIEKDPQEEKKYVDVSRLIQRIINKNSDLPSLYNFILAVNMLKYKKFLSIKDLIKGNIGHIISRTDHECTPEVKKMIESYIQECKVSLKPLIKERDEINQINKYIPVDKEVDFTLLELFYNTMNKKENLKFIKDRENIVFFSIVFFKTISLAFKNILAGEINVFEDKKIKIFSSDYFNIDLAKIDFFIQKLEKLSLQFPSFSKKRYLKIKETSKGALEIEAQIILIIEDILSILINTGNRISEIITLHSIHKRTDQKTIELIDLQKKRITIPCANTIIVKDILFMDMTVTSALSFITTLCYLSGIYFHNNTICLMLGRVQSINSEINAITTILEQIMDMNKFLQLKKKYRL